MFRPATSLAALAALAIAGMSMPADAQPRDRGERRVERARDYDRGRDMQRGGDYRRGRQDYDARRERGGPAGCRGGGSVIGAIAGGLLGNGAPARPC